MTLSKFILDAREQKRVEARLRNKWMIRIRWYYVSILSFVAITSTAIAKPDLEAIKRYIGFLVIGLVVNTLLWLATRPRNNSELYYKIVAFSQIAFDLFLASIVIYTQGALMGRGTILYAIPILMWGVLFLGNYAYTIAGLSAAAYSATLLIYGLRFPNAYPLHEIVVPVFFYSTAFIILAAIVARYSVINALNEREKSYSELMSLLNHQLHHPSGVIAALIEMLEHSESYPSLTAKDKEYLKQLKHENHRLNTMITNLLETAGQPEDSHLAKFEDINIIKVVEETALTCANAAKRRADLKVDYPIKALVMQGQPQQLSIAFENIIDNAFRYSEPGTKVHIAISEHEPRVEIVVDDAGVGMDDKQRKKLFQRFTRMDEGEEEHVYSMGVGLYVSRMIIERHGGKLEVASIAGKGTRVIINLPEE